MLRLCSLIGYWNITALNKASLSYAAHCYTISAYGRSSILFTHPPGPTVVSYRCKSITELYGSPCIPEGIVSIKRSAIQRRLPAMKVSRRDVLLGDSQGFTTKHSLVQVRNFSATLQPASYDKSLQVSVVYMRNPCKNTAAFVIRQCRLVHITCFIINKRALKMREWKMQDLQRMEYCQKRKL